MATAIAGRVRTRRTGKCEIPLGVVAFVAKVFGKFAIGAGEIRPEDD